MPDDGNDLFAAVAHQVYKDASKHLHVRTVIVKHMIEHADFYKKYHLKKDTVEFYKYCDKMS